MKEKQEGKERSRACARAVRPCGGGKTLVKTRRARRHNHLMTTKQELPDEALSTMAIEWRRKALEGDLHARGIAHELETELRRRAGAPFTNYDTLDLRPLESRTARRRWWSFWRAP